MSEVVMEKTISILFWAVCASPEGLFLRLSPEYRAGFAVLGPGRQKEPSGCVTAGNVWLDLF